MERQVIQSVGFRNTVENGEVTGFQLKIRLPYYRGVFLSQVMPGTLIVDGERFEKEDIIWNIKGEDYTIKESFIYMAEFGHHVNDRRLLIV